MVEAVHAGLGLDRDADAPRCRLRTSGPSGQPLRGRSRYRSRGSACGHRVAQHRVVAATICRARRVRQRWGRRDPARATSRRPGRGTRRRRHVSPDPSWSARCWPNSTTSGRSPAATCPPTPSPPPATATTTSPTTPTRRTNQPYPTPPDPTSAAEDGANPYTNLTDVTGCWAAPRFRSGDPGLSTVSIE